MGLQARIRFGLLYGVPSESVPLVWQLIFCSGQTSFGPMSDFVGAPNGKKQQNTSMGSRTGNAQVHLHSWRVHLNLHKYRTCMHQMHIVAITAAHPDKTMPTNQKVRRMTSYNMTHLPRAPERHR